MRAKVFYIHVNKAAGTWTIHASRACIPAKKVKILVPCETVHRPLKKDNPRFFIRCVGHLKEVGDGEYEIQ